MDTGCGVHSLRTMDIIQFLRYFGADLEREDLEEIRVYFGKMNLDGRIIGIGENGRLKGLLLFSITDSPSPFYKKRMWEYISHNIYGEIAYIEKLIIRKWTKEMRLRIEEILISRYPNLEYAAWHRPRRNKDQLVLVKRRLHHV